MKLDVVWFPVQTMWFLWFWLDNIKGEIKLTMKIRGIVPICDPVTKAESFIVTCYRICAWSRTTLFLCHRSPRLKTWSPSSRWQFREPVSGQRPQSSMFLCTCLVLPLLPQIKRFNTKAFYYWSIFFFFFKLTEQTENHSCHGTISSKFY